MSRCPLLIRADSSVALGAGHVMRCLALAQAWQDLGGRTSFVMAGTSSAMKERLRAESIEVVDISVEAGSEKDAGQTIRLARERNADWVVVDGYHFGCHYQQSLKTAGLKVLFIDDYGHAQRYLADIVLNQNAGAAETLYQDRDRQTRLLLGTRYCMLRREFAVWREWKREIPEVGRRVLVTMGGSDPQCFTGVVIQALELLQCPELEMTIVVGSSSPHLAELQSITSQKGITLRTNVLNMAELMAQADVAISAAGSTCWELCLLGLPALLIDLAKNQKNVAEELDRLGSAIHLGNLKDVTGAKIAISLQSVVESQDLRRTLSQSSRALVDGRGAERVTAALHGTSVLRLRPACPNDLRMLWEWANDPAVRAASFSQEFITWDDHATWFAGKMKADRYLIFIAEDCAGIPIGQIRFDRKSDTDCEVDLSIASGRRGEGLAAELIRLAIEQSLKKNHGVRIHALVRLENRASVKTFEKAGFRRVGSEQVRGNDAIHFVYQQD